MNLTSALWLSMTDPPPKKVDISELQYREQIHSSLLGTDVEWTFEFIVSVDKQVIWLMQLQAGFV